ncbi:hypothetical protein [Halalkalibacter krulwichiae]|uniref:Uncharacterized protein n=1 Tax=Halalkalibacter krulwichiae TaxID=199441 RepID=A0A1X9MDH7_9BACI|nr:hypothetical protein [Halalkalibacter krulwichiae]ARK31487.1 hypothetical protein BkAM31D_17490 [Halalkalibacter krulwichiae]
MTRISRLSKLNAERIHSSYVNRMTASGSIQKIEHIQRIEKGENRTNHPSENQLLSYERYFNRDLVATNQPNQSFVDYQKQDNQLEKIVSHFVSSYNQTIVSLSSYDAHTRLKYVQTIYQLFLAYAKELKSIGIFEGSQYTLFFKPSIVKKQSYDQIYHVISIFKKSLLAQYYDIARDLSKEEHSYSTRSLNIKGLLFEKEG